MNKILLTLLLPLTVVIGYSQPKFDNLEIEYGPIFKAAKLGVPNRYIGFDDSGIYMEYVSGSKGKEKITITKFSHQLDVMVQKKNMSIEIEGFVAKPVFFFMVGDQLFQISESNGSNKRRYYVNSINAEDLSPGEIKTISTIFPLDLIKPVQKHFSISKDGSLLSLTTTIPTGKNNNKEIEVNVLTPDLEKKWSQKFVFPIADKLLDIHYTQLDKEGTLHILCKRYFHQRFEMLRDVPNYEYLLFSLYPDGKMDSFSIDSDGKFFRSVLFELSQSEEDFIISGFFSKRVEDGIAGPFYFRYHRPEKKIITRKFQNFDIEFLTANLSKRRSEKVENLAAAGETIELGAYHLDRMFLTEEDEIYLIGEKRLTKYKGSSYVPLSNNVGVSYHRTHYHSMDIISLKFNNLGDLEWTKRIGKNQTTLNDNAIYSSYGLLSHNKGSYFFFNATSLTMKDNDKPNKDKSIQDFESPTLIMSSLSNSGDLKGQVLVSWKDADIKFRPSLSLQLNEDEILIFGHGGYYNVKSQRFIRIRIKEMDE
jgi:hypothetical protein